jgi:hypothetical protein
MSIRNASSKYEFFVPRPPSSAMIRLSLSLLLSLVVYVSCDKLPTCTQFYANIPASADNYNITSPDPASSILHVAGSFRIFFQHCEPSSQTAKKSRHKTVIICHHGLSYNHHYWDIQYQPETYSFVRHAAAEGFPTLIYDTIGNLISFIAVCDSDAEYAY